MSIQRLVFANERFCLQVALPASRESACCVCAKGQVHSPVYIRLAGRQQGIPVPGVLPDTMIVSMKRRYRNTPTALLGQSAAFFLGLSMPSIRILTLDRVSRLWCDLFACEQLNTDSEKFYLDDTMFTILFAFTVFLVLKMHSI